MSVVPPPSENLPIFNPDVFELDDSNISLSQADARYYKKTGGVISGSATIAGTTNLLSTTNISGVVNISNSTQSTAPTNGALVVSGGLGVARDVYSAGIVNISNSTQSTAPTNGALVVSGGLGVARNSHFNGTLHVPVGSATAPTFSFIADPDTGIYRSNVNELGIAANGFLSATISDTGLTSINPITIPTGGVSNCAIQFSGDPNTGIISGGADSLSLVCGGGARMVLSGLVCTLTPPIRTSNASAGAPGFSFSNNSTTGMYLVGTNSLGFSTNGILRQTIDTSRITTTLPIRLPNDNINFSDFGYYESFSQTMIMRYSATQTFNLVVNVVRIGQNITYHVGSDTTLYTINNGPRNLQSETNTFPTRLRPGVNSVFPYAYLTGGLAWTSGKIIFNSDGSMSISPLNAQFITGDSIYIQQFSATVYI
jgi:hypothetical protein